MDYWVQPGDSLWRIAERFYGDGKQWPQLARANRLDEYHHRLLVGQRLQIDDLGGLRPRPANVGWHTPYQPYMTIAVQTPALIPAVPYVFVLADEIDPFREKVVRHVIVHPKMAAKVANKLG